MTSRINRTSIPDDWMARIADSLPEPGPLTRTSQTRMPESRAMFAAFAEACCAANGVPFRDPRKPIAPAEHWATRLPCRSVMLINVLLKVAWICTTPCGTTFFSRFLNVFFLPAVVCCLAMMSMRICLLTRTSAERAFYLLTSTSYLEPSSWRQSRGVGLCASAHSYEFSDHGPAGRAGDASLDSSRYP